jgi:putative ABC transport system ATP-binding protein
MNYASTDRNSVAIGDAFSASAIPVIRTTAISKHFRMGDSVVAALDGIDLAIAKGEFCSIMGPSGSGKSTLLNMIGCLDVVDEGEIWLNGERIDRLSDAQLSRVRNRFIGFVFQSFNLLQQSTAVSNVELPLIYAGESRSRRRQRAIEALQDVGLGDRLFHKPGQLSGGQRQRVAIARALVTRPDVLLADEPTGNLDSAASTDVIAMLRNLNADGNTIVLVTHDETIAKQATRIITMADGRIASDERIPRHV